ncbi:MAG: universal stress protein [Chloroflexota bacterium]|nr:MAG: universal stress protein [Chloroflexota bacterium]
MTARKIHEMNIILAVDGSEHSEAAAKLLRDLPLPRESTITILAVLVPRNASDHARLEKALADSKEILKGIKPSVKTELLTGYPAEQISEYAARQVPDLIVLGAKGRRATLGILLGGVVQQIVEYADDPVLVVRAPYEGIRRILLVTDGSVHSQRALRYLGHFPIPDLTELHVMHVLPPTPSPALIARSWPAGSESMAPMPSYETEEILARQAEEEERHGNALLAETVNMLGDYGIEAKSVLLRGDAATEIIDYTKQNQINLIVAGSRGLSQMRRLLLGSLSRKLVHYAGCSVLIVKGENHDMV